MVYNKTVTMAIFLYNKYLHFYLFIFVHLIDNTSVPILK